GPHSRHAIFVGYPEGTKGYRLRDKDSGTFFFARDVIFDENMPSFASDSDSDDDSTTPVTPPAPTPLTIAPSAPAPPSSPPAPPRRSSRKQVRTAGGQAFAEEIAASKARLQALRDAR
ncbi:hypothetical protein P692DRAFT_20654027, partial [Suillus brevipes Sb2]